MNSVRRLGLADALGIIVALTAVAVWTAMPDAVNHIKLIVLGVGGVAVAPFIVLRLIKIIQNGEEPLGFSPIWILRGSGVALFLWALVSAIGTDTTWQDNFYGAWGRNFGLLALFAAITIYIGATTLNRIEIERVLSWLVAVAVIEVLVGALQLVLPNPVPSAQGEQGSITGTFGNTNFAAGYFAVLLAVVIGRALARRTSLFQRVLASLLTFALLVLMWQTNASQSIGAGVAAIGVFIVAFAVAYRGPHRRISLSVGALVAVIGVLGLVTSFFGIGPLARLWTDTGFAIRQEYWKATWNTFINLPLFGTGPDGLKRIMGEYRPESYVALLGEENKLDAAHNIALQIAATLGVVGILFWSIVFVGSLSLIIRRVIVGPNSSPVVAATLLAAFVAYLVQGAVSIDMLPLLAVGWLIAGLSVAYSAREVSIALFIENNSVEESMNRRAHPRSQKSRQLINEETETNFLPVIVATSVSALLVIAVGWLLYSFMDMAARTLGRVDPDFALEAIVDPMTTCQARNGIAQAAIATLPAEELLPALKDATAIDPRCGFMIHFQSELANNTGDFDLTETSTQMGIEFDPLLPASWVLRGIYLVNQGDLAGARAALGEAERIAELSPTDGSAEEQIQVLRDQVAQLEANSG